MVHTRKILVFGLPFFFIFMHIYAYSCTIGYLVDCLRCKLLRLVVSYSTVITVSKWSILVHLDLTMSVWHLEIVINRV
jgi:hypothetical protein